jgi:hypothetical protein
LQIDILTHIPLPIAVDETGPFLQFEPHPFDLMAARGVVVLDTSAKGALGVVAAMLPDVFANVQAAKDAAKSSRGDNRNSIIYGYSTVRVGKLKLEGARYAVPVKIADGATLPTGATFTETEPMTEKHVLPEPAIYVVEVSDVPDLGPERTKMPDWLEPRVYEANLPTPNGDFDVFEVTEWGEILKVWDAEHGMSGPMLLAAE